jgi:hypothetical protein
MRRFKNVCWCAFALFVVNLLLDKSVSGAIGDQLESDETVEEYSFYESRYGNFEDLVNERRKAELFSRLPRARAADVTLSDRDGNNLAVVDDVYRDKDMMEDLTTSQEAVDMLAA